MCFFSIYHLLFLVQYYGLLGNLTFPLYESYHGKTLERIRQDVYDRFFTRIEQRFTREEIMTLKDTFSNVIVSNQLPYWHFLVKR